MAQARRPSRLAFCALALSIAAACGSNQNELKAPVQLEPAAAEAGCGPVTKYPSEGKEHLADGAKGSYKTKPPHSGSHAQRWAPMGIHSREVTDEAQVHNLEHGHVVIQYVPGKIDTALLNGFVDLAKANSKWIVLAPRSAGRFDPPAVLAFTAWTVVQTCDAPTPKALDEARDFSKKYGQKGPEHVPGRPVMESPPAS